MMCDMLWGEQLKGCDHCHSYKKSSIANYIPEVTGSHQLHVPEHERWTCHKAENLWAFQTNSTFCSLQVGGKSVLFTYSQTASALIASWWRGISCSLTLRNNPWFNTHSDTHSLTLSQPVTPPPLLDEVIIAGRESPCIDRPFSTRAPHTYI